MTPLDFITKLLIVTLVILFAFALGGPSYYVIKGIIELWQLLILSIGL
jgi:hypothetical protein